MTEKKSKAKPTDKPYAASPPLKKTSFTNDLGYPQVVFIPEGEKDLKAGIPISLDLTPLFGHMPESFQRELYKALHAQGLIEPVDFFKAGAADRYRRALLTVIKHDFLSIQSLAKEELNHA